jgi:beta-galactosidase
VELILNGRSLGIKDVAHDDFAEWQVPYQAGRLVAKGYTGGKAMATEELDTTGPAAGIQLAPAFTDLAANGEDAVVVPVSILDQQGRIVPDSDNQVNVQLSGGGRLVGIGNGNPADHDPDRATRRKVFHGHCLVIIQAGPEPATLQLTATSPGLAPAATTIKVR